MCERDRAATLFVRLAQARRRAQGRRDCAAAEGRKYRPRPVVFGPATESPLFPAPTSLGEVRPPDRRIVASGTREGRLWNGFVARYRHLGYRTLVGARMRYAVHDCNGRPLAMHGFSTAAWKLAPRDRFIGWTPEKREKNLPLAVDNLRFLILPWIEIPNLGSHILAIVRRRLPGTGPSATAPRPCSSERSSNPRASPPPSTGPRAGYGSGPPRDAGATTATSSTTS